MPWNRVTVLQPDRDRVHGQDVETGFIQRATNISLGLREAALRSDHVGKTVQHHIWKRLGGKCEKTLGIQPVRRTFKERLNRSKIRKDVCRCDHVPLGACAVVFFKLFQKFDGFANIQIVVNLPIVGQFDDPLGKIDTCLMSGAIGKVQTGQTGAAPKIEQTVKRAQLQPANEITQQQRNAIAECVDEYLVKDVGVLIKQRCDIGIGHFFRRRFRSDRGKTNARATTVFRVQSQHFAESDLGAFQVAPNGDLANWSTGEGGVPAVGGAMDLSAGAKTVRALTTHVTKDGAPKLVDACTYPLTGLGVVDRVYTDLAVVEIVDGAFHLRELVPGVSAEEIQALTGAPLATENVRPLVAPAL